MENKTELTYLDLEKLGVQDIEDIQYLANDKLEMQKGRDDCLASLRECKEKQESGSWELLKGVIAGYALSKILGR